MVFSILPCLNNKEKGNDVTERVRVKITLITFQCNLHENLKKNSQGHLLMD